MTRRTWSEFHEITHEKFPLGAFARRHKGTITPTERMPGYFKQCPILTADMIADRDLHLQIATAFKSMIYQHFLSLNINHSTQYFKNLFEAYKKKGSPYEQLEPYMLFAQNFYVRLGLFLMSDKEVGTKILRHFDSFRTYIENISMSKRRRLAYIDMKTAFGIPDLAFSAEQTLKLFVDAMKGPSEFTNTTIFRDMAPQYSTGCRPLYHVMYQWEYLNRLVSRWEFINQKPHPVSEFFTQLGIDPTNLSTSELVESIINYKMWSDSQSGTVGDAMRQEFLMSAGQMPIFYAAGSSVRDDLRTWNLGILALPEFQTHSISTYLHTVIDQKNFEAIADGFGVNLQELRQQNMGKQVTYAGGLRFYVHHTTSLVDILFVLTDQDTSKAVCFAYATKRYLFSLRKTGIPKWTYPDGLQLKGQEAFTSHFFPSLPSRAFDPVRSSLELGIGIRAIRKEIFLQRKLADRQNPIASIKQTKDGKISVVRTLVVRKLHDVDPDSGKLSPAQLANRLKRAVIHYVGTRQRPLQRILPTRAPAAPRPFDISLAMPPIPSTAGWTRQAPVITATIAPTALDDLPF